MKKILLILIIVIMSTTSFSWVKSVDDETFIIYKNEKGNGKYVVFKEDENSLFTWSTNDGYMVEDKNQKATAKVVFKNGEDEDIRVKTETWKMKDDDWNTAIFFPKEIILRVENIKEIIIYIKLIDGSISTKSYKNLGQLRELLKKDF